MTLYVCPFLCNDRAVRFADDSMDYVVDKTLFTKILALNFVCYSDGSELTRNGWCQKSIKNAFNVLIFV